MLSSSSFSSFSQDDHSKLRFSERSCFLEDSEASFVPCDTDLQPLATQEVTSAHETKTALEQWSPEFERWSTALSALCFAMIFFITYKTESFEIGAAGVKRMMN